MKRFKVIRRQNSRGGAFLYQDVVKIFTSGKMGGGRGAISKGIPMVELSMVIPMPKHMLKLRKK